MRFIHASSLAEALDAKASYPGALAVAGGTDVMVDLNFGRRRPAFLIDLSCVSELVNWSRKDGVLRLGAGMTYTRVIEELGDLLPGLALAARTVGSPQIRNRGTIGGNLGSASPAGDAHPPLLAADATVEIISVSGRRFVPIAEFFTGPKHNVLADEELVAAVLVPQSPGPQQFAKVGTRNAMVIAIASFALEIDPGRNRIGTGIGSAAPTPVVASAAARFLEGHLSETGRWDSRDPLDEKAVQRFGELVAEGASPIDDVRGSAAYRRHALAVLAARTLSWSWDDYRRN